MDRYVSAYIDEEGGPQPENGDGGDVKEVNGQQRTEDGNEHREA